MLAILRFLIRMAEFTEMSYPWTGVVGTDSQSLLDTLCDKDETRLERDRDEPINMSGAPVVLDCACPDWDILIEIQDALVKLPRIKLQHVKGHQDRERAYHTLDQMAQLNEDADARARQYQDSYGAVRPFVLMALRTKVHLLGHHGTVTRKYDTYLRMAATTPPLRTHLMEKYSWTTRVLDTINWDAHRRAIKRMYKRRTHLTKLVFDILPTTSLLNKYDNGHRTCPSCQCSHEDRDHILQCLCSRRVTWRLEFMESLNDFCRDTQTDDEVQTLLRISMEQWFSNPATDLQLSHAQFSPSLQSIIQQQNQIRWRQIFNGRFAMAWSQTRNAAYERRPRSNTEQTKMTGEKWQIQLITHIWTQWEKAWEDRNKALHGNTTAEKNTAIRRDVRRQLDVRYQNRHLMEPSVQTLLYENPEEHERQQLTTTRNWLAQHGQVFKESIRRVRSRAIQNVRSIRTYFSTAGGG